MKNLFILLGIILTSAASLKAQEKFTVTVNINGITNETGTIYASLTTDESTFPGGQNPMASKVIKVEGNEVSFEFESVLGGTDYAIVLFQDLNGDSKMNRNGSMPAEPFGFSNYVMMGPPSWTNCSFLLEENKEVTINLYSL
ncbi:DUF2141 domain-containing protein [Arcticibacterium luteifluviistationis]|uniref:DUF2141 domain-containing protein n=1 Tax=Arcticibacterium luteifluviistationis TaxID=1784714 RepID=A0A2Z4GEU5_9BACT|nr:DUF2141 domain-containing protein [Arcticibacterium luteifluviistationis]AWV99508.1 hypothetical protein DJ013_15585 [Arcticibacterium luteifluviistationis]